MARRLLKSKEIPRVFWGVAITTNVYLLNCAPTKSVNGMTPYKSCYQRKPSVKHLCTFGRLAHVKVTRPGIKKLSNYSVPMVLRGYKRGSKVYWVYNPVTKRFHVSRDIMFQEEKWNWGASSSQQQSEVTRLICC